MVPTGNKAKLLLLVKAKQFIIRKILLSVNSMGCDLGASFL